MSVGTHSSVENGIGDRYDRFGLASGGHAKYAPYRSTALYNANKGLDRDHDHVACEQ